MHHTLRLITSIARSLVNQLCVEELGSHSYRSFSCTKNNVSLHEVLMTQASKQASKQANKQASKQANNDKMMDSSLHQDLDFRSREGAALLFRVVLDS
jgi:hypothetical protein